MKIPADQVLRTWTGSPALGAALQRCDWPSQICPLGCKGIRSASRRWWSFQNLWRSQVLTSVPNRISHPKLSFRYDKWLSLRNEYDIPFEMRICTCVVKPFGSLQVVIRIREWQAAGSRIRQVQTSEAGARPIFSKWFMTLVSRAEPFLSDASQIETARRRGRRAVISRA